MKFRQAKKIIKREIRKREQGKRSYYGWLLGSPQWMEAERVYMRHVNVSRFIKNEYRKVVGNSKV